MKCPTLTADHKKARMDFARAHMSWTSEWIEYKLYSIQVIFNVEKKFNLRWSRRVYFLLERFEKGAKVFPTRNFGGGSLMKKFIFKQDNIAILVLCSTRDWFQSWNTVIIDWSSRSPNLDPMENLWRILARQMKLGTRKDYLWNSERKPH
uniref:Transposable element Tc1 transposase n=1 Tax=Heterorhabditis bacteriophora TaxID=37862 RepID=A0A1I7X3A7_HETBA